MTELDPQRACEWLERLPWYVNGSADRRESAAVAQHVEQCPHCTAELAFWHAADDAVRADTTTPRVDSPEQLNRLLSQIDARPENLQSAKGNPTSVAGLGRWLESLRSPFTVPAWALAAPALLVVAVGVSLMLGRGDAVTGEFETLSSPAPVSIPGLSVVIDDAVTLGDARELLASHELTVVSGPTGAGVWRLAVSSDTDLETLIATLRADARVLLAEPGGAR